jgi:hypothetical protein
VLEIQPDCITPLNTKGVCVDIRNCVSAMGVLKNKDHLTNPDVAIYMRKSQCGRTLGSHQVCCELEDFDVLGNEIDQSESQFTTHFYDASL